MEFSDRDVIPTPSPLAQNLAAHNVRPTSTTYLTHQRTNEIKWNWWNWWNWFALCFFCRCLVQTGLTGFLVIEMEGPSFSYFNCDHHHPLIIIVSPFQTYYVFWLLLMTPCKLKKSCDDPSQWVTAARARAVKCLLADLDAFQTEARGQNLWRMVQICGYRWWSDFNQVCTMLPSASSCTRYSHQVIYALLNQGLSWVFFW